MSHLDKELSQTLKSLGKQAEAHMPSELHSSARLAASGNPSSATSRKKGFWTTLRRPAWAVAASLALVAMTGLTVASASGLTKAEIYEKLKGMLEREEAGLSEKRKGGDSAEYYEQGLKVKELGVEVWKLEQELYDREKDLASMQSVATQPEACGDPKTIEENLKLAAETLPLPSSRSDIDYDGGKIPDHSDLAILNAEQAKGRLSVVIGQEEVKVDIWGGPSGHMRTYGASFYRFPKGSLTEQAKLADVVAGLEQAKANGVLLVTRVTSFVDFGNRDEFNRNEGPHGWSLTQVLADYTAGKGKCPCVVKTVPHQNGGPVEFVDLPMLYLGKGNFVGFMGDRVVTFRLGAGWVMGGDRATWYPVPGLKPNK